MSLPEFDELGDLPVGVHRAAWQEVIDRFGGATAQRLRCTRILSHIHDIAVRTGHLSRFVIFGSYVTAKPDPNDVDVILVMDDDFHRDEIPLEMQGLFDHAVAQARFGASVFWVKPSALIGDQVDDFVAHWQVKRDNSKRGIVEVVS